MGPHGFQGAIGVRAGWVEGGVGSDTDIAERHSRDTESLIEGLLVPYWPTKDLDRTSGVENS